MSHKLIPAAILVAMLAAPAMADTAYAPIWFYPNGDGTYVTKLDSGYTRGRRSYSLDECNKYVAWVTQGDTVAKQHGIFVECKELNMPGWRMENAE
jgi:hypothetical protein